MYFEYGIFSTDNLNTLILLCCIVLGFIFLIPLAILMKWDVDDWFVGFLASLFTTAFIGLSLKDYTNFSVMEFYQKYATKNQKRNFSRCVQDYRLVGNLSKEEVQEKLLDGYALDIAEFCSRSKNIAKQEQTVKESTDPCIRLYQTEKGLTDRDMAVIFYNKEDKDVYAYCAAKQAVNFPK